MSSRGVEWVAGLPIAVRRLFLCLVVILKQDCSKKLQKASIGRWRAIPDPDHARAATCYKARAVTCYGARVVTCYGAKVVTGYGARIVTCDGAKAFTCYGARVVTCFGDRVVTCSGARSFTCSTPSVPRSCRGARNAFSKAAWPAGNANGFSKAAPPARDAEIDFESCLANSGAHLRVRSSFSNSALLVSGPRRGHGTCFRRQPRHHQSPTTPERGFERS